MVPNELDLDDPDRDAAFNASGFRIFFDSRPQSDFRPGIQIGPDDCQAPGESAMVTNALRYTLQFARAGLEASTESDGKLFSMFFNDGDQEAVQSAFRGLIDILTKKEKTTPVVIKCLDVVGNCAEWGTAYVLDADHSPHQDSVAPIFLCSGFANLPELLDPCNQDHLGLQTAAEGQCRASDLLHELLHVDFIAGPTVKHLDDHGYGSFAAHALKVKKAYGVLDHDALQHKPTENVDNYVSLAIWAWMRKSQRRRCPANYPLWGALDKIPRADKVRGRSTELRRLLGVDGNEQDGEKIPVAPEVRSRVNGIGYADVVECDETCGERGFACRNSPAGTLPTDGCYPQIAINSKGNERQVWAASFDSNVPTDTTAGMDLSKHEFVASICPDAINALCTSINDDRNDTTNHKTWTWAIGSTPGCLVGARLPARPPTHPDCQLILYRMAEALFSANATYQRVSVNTASPPDLPDVNNLGAAGAGPIAVTNIGAPMNASISSWVLQA